MKKLVTTVVFGTISFFCFAQNVAINASGAVASSSAILDVSSTNSGALIPRMTKAQRDLIGSPTTALLIYQTDNTPGFYYYDGSGWVSLTGWSLQGNSGTTVGTNFLGTTDAQDLAFYSNNTEYMRLTSTGSLALGKTTAGYRIDMNGDINVNQSLWGALRSSGNWIIGQNPSDQIHIGSNNVANDILFGASGFANGMLSTIKANGNFGIGTVDPQNKLDIEGGCAIGSGYSGTTWPVNTPQNGTPTNGLIVEGDVGIGLPRADTSKLHVHYSGASGTSTLYLSTGHNFNTARYHIRAYTGGGGALADAFWLNHTGQMYVRASIGINTTAATQTLDVNGNARFRSVASGAFSSNLNLTADGTLTTNTSDRRLKTAIKPLENSLEKLLRLQGVSYLWKEHPEAPLKDFGFVAQEVEPIFPEVVFTNKVDGYKGINYDRFVAILTEAIKEQQKIIERQENEISLVKMENKSLKAEMEQKNEAMNLRIKLLEDHIKTSNK